MYPNGLWRSTLSGIVTSLGHIATYTSDVFPSPQWNEEHPLGQPSDTHLHIAREINAKHRQKMLIRPEAHFDQSNFVFGASKPTLSASFAVEAASVLRQNHRSLNLTRFYRSLLREIQAMKCFRSLTLRLSSLSTLASIFYLGSKGKYYCLFFSERTVIMKSASSAQVCRDQKTRCSTFYSFDN